MSIGCKDILAVILSFSSEADLWNVRCVSRIWYSVATGKENANRIHTFLCNRIKDSLTKSHIWWNTEEIGHLITIDDPFGLTDRIIQLFKQCGWVIYTDDNYEQLMDVQEYSLMTNKEMRKIMVVIEDEPPYFWKSHVAQRLVFNGRHYNLTLLIVKQKIPYSLKAQIDTHITVVNKDTFYIRKREMDDEIFDFVYSFMTRVDEFQKSLMQL